MPDDLLPQDEHYIPTHHARDEKIRKLLGNPDEPLMVTQKTPTPLVVAQELPVVPQAQVAQVPSTVEQAPAMVAPVQPAVSMTTVQSLDAVPMQKKQSFLDRVFGMFAKKKESMSAGAEIASPHSMRDLEADALRVFAKIKDQTKNIATHAMDFETPVQIPKNLSEIKTMAQSTQNIQSITKSGEVITPQPLPVYTSMKEAEKKLFENTWEEYEQKKKKEHDQGIVVNNVSDINKVMTSQEKEGGGLFTVGALTIATLCGVSILVLMFAVLYKPKSISVPAEEAIVTTEPFFTDVTKKIAITSESSAEVEISNFLSSDDSKEEVVRYSPQLNGIPLSSQEILKYVFKKTYPIAQSTDVGLVQNIGPYYVFGKNNKAEKSNYFIIFTFKDNEAFQAGFNPIKAMLSIKKYLIDDLSVLFPSVFTTRSTTSDDRNFTSTIVQNRYIYTFKGENNTSFSYYFYSNNILVFVVGDPSSIDIINKRLESGLSIQQ